MKREIEEKIISQIKYEHLNTDEQLLCDIVGIEQVKQMILEGGGFRYYIRKLICYKDIINKTINEELLSGKSIKHIARDMGLSEKQIREAKVCK